jgi:hypothetical protein
LLLPSWLPTFGVTGTGTAQRPVNLLLLSGKTYSAARISTTPDEPQSVSARRAGKVVVVDDRWIGVATSSMFTPQRISHLQSRPLPRHVVGFLSNRGESGRVVDVGELGARCSAAWRS